ncbi:unnamed protein product [Heterobilharzia americana]|nr:unnamed protein product [Heterobilharzia americana]
MVKTRTNHNNSQVVNNITEDSMDEFCGDDPGSPYTSGTDRKRRRGVIEKRRRDRINYSLAELKRLVPDSNHKPGSAKLEKAEILQLTVEFLQRLHKEGYVLGSEARSIELRRTGFKDCLLEVTRLLSTYDGINISSQELTRHLLNHLHQCEKQRDLESKTYLTNIAAVANVMLTQTSSSNISSTTIGQYQQNHQQQSNYQHQHFPNYFNDSSLMKSKSTKSNSFICEQSNKLSITPSSTNKSLKSLHTNTNHQAYPCSDSSVFYNNDNTYTPYQCVDFQMLGQQNPYRYTYKVGDRESEQPSNYYLPSDFCHSNYAYGEQSSRNLSYSSSSLSTTLSTTTAPVGAEVIRCVTNHTNDNFIPPSFISTAYPTMHNINGSSLLSTGLGPNESQSTSSPPFRSTPEDSEIGFSPHLKNNLSGIVGSDEVEDECNYYTTIITATVSSATMTTSVAKTIPTAIYQPSNYHNDYDYTYHEKNDVCMNLSTGDYQSFNSQLQCYNRNPLYSNYPTDTWRQTNKTTDLVQYQDYILHSQLPSTVLEIGVHTNTSTTTTTLSSMTQNISTIANNMLSSTINDRGAS